MAPAPAVDKFVKWGAHSPSSLRREVLPPAQTSCDGKHKTPPYKEANGPENDLIERLQGRCTALVDQVC